MQRHLPIARWALLSVLLVLGSGRVHSLHAQPATLQAPASATIGSTIAVSWTGPSATQEFISIDSAGAPSSRYGTYVYANVTQPAELKMPDLPGSYVLRYHTSASGYPVIASRPIAVTDVQAQLDALAPVDAGGSISVTWRGPGQPGDFISIDPPGADDRQYGTYAYATETPVTIRVPDAGGDYVVRYHLAGSYRVIGQTPLTVGRVQASVAGPAQAQAGSEVSVTWTGPGAALDYVSVDSAGAPEGEYGVYGYARDGSPLALRLPDAPGKYEIRYHMGQSGAVIARSPIEVLPNTATLTAPATVVGGTDFEVRWTGPDNDGDWVTIAPAGADDRTYRDYAYTREGAALTLEAPLDAGPHELRYMTGRSRQILASVRITVTPGALPGSVRVTGGRTGVPGPGTGAVEVILDASGSMLQRIGGVRRIELAQQALRRLVGQVIPAGTPFAFRAFGHREAGSCRTDLEIPLAPLTPASATSRVGSVQALNLSRTPIGASLALVKEDLAAARGPLVVVLVTDGEETCDGDPPAAIQALTQSGIDVRVNIVGFAIEEQQLRETFQEWARLGNGRYVEANNGDELAAAMGAALSLPYEVLEGDEVVGGGIVGGPAVRLAPGTYRIRILGGAPRELPPVTVESGGELIVNADGPG
jgi:hypothetical protein